MNALDLHQLSEANFKQAANGKSVCFNNLPVVSINTERGYPDDMAILSWRWDLNDDASRNVYIACQEAKKQGIKFILIDKISINQALSDQNMLFERLTFSKLYQQLPVFATYDCPASQPRPTAVVHGTTLTLGNEFAWLIRRPWIFYEVQLYRSNPTRVTYIGYMEKLGCSEDFGFNDLVDSIWSAPMDAVTKTIFYTLQGTVNMNYIEEFRYIFPQYYDILSTAFSKLSRNDYLLFVAILAGGGRVNNDQNILNIQFDQFTIGQEYTPADMPITQDYYTRYDIHFKETLIGYWQTRDKFYPFEDLRVWFSIYENAEKVIINWLGCHENTANPFDPPILLAADDKRPAVKVVLHALDLL